MTPQLWHQNQSGPIWIGPNVPGCFLVTLYYNITKQIYSWFPLDEGMKVVLCHKSDYWSRKSASSSISVRCMWRRCVSGRCCLDGNPLILWINTVCKLFLLRILWAVFIKTSNSWPTTCFTSSVTDSDPDLNSCLTNRMSGWCSQVHILSPTFVSQGFRRRIPSFYWLKYMRGWTLGRSVDKMSKHCEKHL